MQFKAQERVCFPGENRFIVIGPCGANEAVYATSETMAKAEKEAKRLNELHFK